MCEPSARHLDTDRRSQPGGVNRAGCLELVASAIIFPIVKIVLKISTVGKGSLLLGTTGEGRRQKKCYYNYALSHIHKPGRKNPASEAVYAKLLIIL